MEDKNFSKFITEDVKLINEQLNNVALDSNLKKFIDKNIYFIKKTLKNLVEIKKHGSYATKNLYNFENEINIDLLAIKYVSNKMYKIYENELSTKDHFDDCWICEINELIFQTIFEKYSISKEVNVEWKVKKYRILNSENIVTFRDSIKISFLKDNKIGFSILIRTALSHNDYPLIICNKNMYKRSFSLDFLRTYKVLNKLLVKKLQILFFYIRLKYRRNTTKIQRLKLKINIMSDVQYQLLKNKFLQIWLDKSFDFNFSSKKDVDNLLNSKLIYYKKTKKISKFYNSFKLKNLNWVFHKTYPSTKDFLDYYLNFSENFWNVNKNINKVYFWYDSVAYLKNTSGTTNISIKKDSKKFDNLELSIYSKPVYPLNKENGVFLIFLQYYNFEIN